MNRTERPPARRKRPIRQPWPEALEQWQGRTAPWLMALALLFLITYSTTILFPGLPGWYHTASAITDITVWAIFGLDYVKRLQLVGRGRRAEFIRSTPLEAIAVLLPPARPLRLLRVVAIGTEILLRQTRAMERSRMGVFVGGSIFMLMFLASLAVLDAERLAEHSQINDWPTAAWWAVVTVATVGYGDVVPVTLAGRSVAIVLMITGIGLFGFVAASLASWITEKIDNRSEELEELEDDTDQLLLEVRELRRELAELRAELRQSLNHAKGPPPTLVIPEQVEPASPD